MEYINHPRYRDAWPQSDTYGILWDDQSQTPWYRYFETSEWHHVWFDTDTSLGLKYNLAETNALQGVGIWALGYDGAYSELWNELRKRYGQPSAIRNTSIQIGTFVLKQNYPNPFNPTTTISYSLKGPLLGQLSVAIRVELSIYNYLGQKVATLISRHQSAGEHKVDWDASGLPSGLYFYQLRTTNHSEVRKMMLLK